MIISEKDIFYFVFDPHGLEKDKISYIEKNLKDFKDQIDLCRSIQSSLNNDIDPVIISKIEEKIKEKQATTNIELFRVKERIDNHSEYFTLAADSKAEKEKIKVDTYCDANTNYIVKVISTPNEKKVIVFEKNNDIIDDFDLKILPADVLYEHLSNQQPLVISPEIDIEKIILSIN